MKKVIRLNEKDIESLVKRIIKESSDDEWHPSWRGELSSEEEFVNSTESIQSMLDRLSQIIESTRYTVDDMDYIFHVEQSLIDLMDEIGEY